MLDIRTRIRTDLNPSKRIRFRIRSKNIRTVFIPRDGALLVTLCESVMNNPSRIKGFVVAYMLVLVANTYPAPYIWLTSRTTLRTDLVTPQC